MISISNKDAIERFFKHLDNLIDDDVDDLVTLVRSDEALRKRCYRLFPPTDEKSSTRLALEAYGFSFNTYKPSEIELESCLFIGDDYEVSIDKLRFNELLSICNLRECELSRILRPYIKNMRFIALSEFVRSHSPEEVSYKNLKAFPNLLHTISVLGGMDSFRKLYSIDKKLSLYELDSKEWIYILHGLEFESLLRKHLFKDLDYQKRYRDAIPDFVDGDVWIDAKLSKSTALNSNDNTIDKYLKYVNKLKIIYLFDDGADVSSITDDSDVCFEHVSEYYKDLSDSSIEVFEDLIYRVGILKGKST